jgi:hypothetical protein
MRKCFLYLLAAFMLTSCDNLKKKDKTSDDDTEETTKKKKKALDEDEIADDDETSKKKKKVSDEENLDEESTDGWSNADRKKFLSTCVPDAEEKAGKERATVYCNCFLKKAEQRYSSYSEANQKMDKTEVDEIAAGCNNN